MHRRMRAVIPYRAEATISGRPSTSAGEGSCCLQGSPLEATREAGGTLG
jgi:hypothetical protein